MSAIRGILARARQLGRIVGDGVVDSGKAALYVRQLLRGNHAAPSILTVSRPAIARGGRPDPGAPSPGAGAAVAATPVLLLHGYLATRVPCICSRTV